MKTGRWVLVVAAPLLIGAKPAGERTIVGDGLLAGSVSGVPARIRVDPGAISMPILSPDFARRAGLRPSFLNFDYQVGARRIDGQSAVTRIDVGDGAVKRRVGWSIAPLMPGSDVVVGPGMLPQDVVRFQMRPARSGERSVALPMVGQGGLDGRWGERFALIQVGGAPLRIQFEPRRQRTLATASAGARIAAAHGGALSGAVESDDIAFGIRRPVRQMNLAAPLAIGPLALRSLGVRVRDFGSAATIPERDADPSEIVVTAAGKSSKAVDQLRVGADQLDRCSSITFDRRRNRIFLSCLPG